MPKYQSLGILPCLIHIHSGCTSSGQQTWIYLIFQGSGLRRVFLLVLSPPHSFHSPTVHQNQWHVAGKGFSYRLLGLLLLLGFHYMPRFTSGDYGTWQGSWLRFHWCYAWYYTVAWLPGIGRGCGDTQIGLRSRASFGLSGTQWGISLTWPPVRWRLRLY